MTNGPDRQEGLRVVIDEQIPIDGCLLVARDLQADGRPWHSHVLTPGCVHNPLPGYALVLEDDGDARVYAAPSPVFPEVDKELVRMMHGDDIIDRDSTAAATGGRVESELVDRARALDRVGHQWHHHMCFPTCAFNVDPGRWTITVEYAGEFWSESWQDEPADVLRELEVLFFGRE